MSKEKHRIAILDIDYHHGNGSKCSSESRCQHADFSSSRAAQEIFYSDPSVLYASLHAEDDYPCMISVFTSDSGYFPPIDFTGAVTEKGIGEGVNTNFNYPLPRDTQDDDYCTTLRKAIEDIRKFDPAYLLLRFCTSIYGRDDTDRTFY